MVPKHLSAAERREQVMDAARALFLERGYEKTTIEDVLGRVGIAKGTLYHHFPGKEAIMEAIVARTTDQLVERAEQAARSSAGQPAMTRFLSVLSAARASEEDIELAQQFRSPDNLRFHLLSMTQAYTRLVPILTDLIEEGVSAGELSSPDPRSSVEVVLAAGFTVLDGGIFLASTQDVAARRQAEVLRAATALFGADPLPASAGEDPTAAPH
ncbi:TetR/AcrR family transcriptional regulator [Actinomyces howellii]|uniref:HTH-type transcriptional repressor KstR2 n=1 Tax=Actinomyces howellii TaxID=52771 RepID=A0A448HGU8_9ACTO|nr:TetR/AcrR family transcriptional regulator [Actinomyces howellii]VEG28132.1 HTH-type transcriptional repressor KstR2 [Actinomyces howellii]